MNTNPTAVVSPPLKHSKNIEIGTVLTKFARLVEAAPIEINETISVTLWIRPDNKEDTQDFLKYAIALGATIEDDGSNSLNVRLKTKGCNIVFYVTTKHLEFTETEVTPQPQKVKKIINFPELEAALSPTEPKVQPLSQNATPPKRNSKA